MPGLGVRLHLLGAEAAHLVTHRRKRLVQSGIADRAALLGDERCEASTVLRRIASLDHRAGHAEKCRNVVCGKSEISRPDELGLRHRDAVRGLVEILAGADPGEKPLDLAEPALLLHARGVGGDLPHGLRIGGEPGETVRRVLMGFDQSGGDPSAIAHEVTDRQPRPRQERAERIDGSV